MFYIFIILTASKNVKGFLHLIFNFGRICEGFLFKEKSMHIHVRLRGHESACIQQSI